MRPGGLRYIPTEDIDYWWPMLEGMFQRATDRVPGELEPSAILHHALADEFRLWVIEDDNDLLLAGAVGETGDGYVRIYALAGRDMGRWLSEALTEFEILARNNGLKGVRVCGRPGWSRVLPGYRLCQVTMEKKFDAE